MQDRPVTEYDPATRRFTVTVNGRYLGSVDSYLQGEAMGSAYLKGLADGQASLAPVPHGGKKALSITETAEALGIARDTVYKLVNSGEIPSFRAGSRHLVPVAALEAYMQRGREQPEPVDLSILDTRPYHRRHHS